MIYIRLPCASGGVNDIQVEEGNYYRFMLAEENLISLS